MPGAYNKFNQNNRSWACNHSKACLMYEFFCLFLLVGLVLGWFSFRFFKRSQFICQLEDLKWMMNVIPCCFPSFVAIRMVLIGHIKFRMVYFIILPSALSYTGVGYRKWSIVVVLVATDFLVCGRGTQMLSVISCFSREAECSFLF